MRGPPGHVLLPFHWQMTNFISADDRHAYGRVQFVGRASAREDSLETYASDRRFRLAVCRILQPLRRRSVIQAIPHLLPSKGLATIDALENIELCSFRGLRIQDV